MAITDDQRRGLYTELEQALGVDHASTLMQLLPAQPADELVTISYFQTEMRAHSAELRGEMAELRGEMGELRGEMRGEMAELRGDLTRDMTKLQSDLTSDMTKLRSDVTSEIGDVRNELKASHADLTVTMTNLRAEFVDRFSQTDARITRLFATSIAANVVAVVTALTV